MSKEERFEWLYNDKVLKHYMVDNLNNKQLKYEDIVKLLNQQAQKIAELEKENNHLKTFVWNKDDDDEFRNCKSDNQKFMAYSIAKNLLHSEIEKVKELEKQLAKVKNSCDYYMNRANDLVLKLAEQPKQIIEIIIEKYNLNRKPIIDNFGNVAFGYATINADKLKEFLDNLLKEYSND